MKQQQYINNIGIHTASLSPLYPLNQQTRTQPVEQKASPRRMEERQTRRRTQENLFGCVMH